MVGGFIGMLLLSLLRVTGANPKAKMETQAALAVPEYRETDTVING